MAEHFLGNNMPAILACRVIFGFGFGLCLPVSNMFILGFWDGAPRDRMLGLSTIAMSVGGIIYQLVGGFVCVLDVRATWLVHLLALIPLVFILFLKEPPHPEEVASQEAETDSTKTASVVR